MWGSPRADCDKYKKELARTGGGVPTSLEAACTYLYVRGGIERVADDSFIHCIIPPQMPDG